mmetsp:Transcript_5385/g.21783  ORF Transcript_5385/g.21783 Transcript_5385/m.21783 type:complete len:385 (-) Transcript_5385:93-1247(-)
MPPGRVFTRNAPHAVVGSASSNPSPDSASTNEAEAEAEAEASVTTRNTRVASTNPRMSVASSGAHMDVTPPKPGGETVVTDAATPKVTRAGAPPAVSKKLPSSPRAPGAKPSTGASGGARSGRSPRSASEGDAHARLTASRAYRYLRYLSPTGDEASVRSDRVRSASVARIAAEPSATKRIAASPSIVGSIAVGAGNRRRGGASTSFRSFFPSSACVGKSGKSTKGVAEPVSRSTASAARAPGNASSSPSRRNATATDQRSSCNRGARHAWHRGAHVSPGDARATTRAQIRERISPSSPLSPFSASSCPASEGAETSTAPNSPRTKNRTRDAPRDAGGASPRSSRGSTRHALSPSTARVSSSKTTLKTRSCAKHSTECPEDDET